jgi:hypothetical protein
VAAFAVMVAIASTASAEGTAGKGALGGTIGVPSFLADDDTKNGQSPRVLGQGQFLYAFSDRTRLSASFGYGWIGYKDGTPAPYKLVDPPTGDSVLVMNQALTKFQPITVSILHSLKDQGASWVPYVGGGVNLTRIEIVNDRRTIKDPATFASYINWAPGLQAQVGTEYFLASNEAVSFDWHVRYNHLFSKDEKKFPSGFTGSHSYVTVNFGVNVYFWPIGHKPIEIAPAPQPLPDAAAPVVPDLPEETEDPAPAPAPTPPETPESSAGHSSSILSRSPELCPARPTPEVTTGMFGIPGAPLRLPHLEGDSTP